MSLPEILPLTWWNNLTDERKRYLKQKYFSHREQPSCTNIMISLIHNVEMREIEDMKEKEDWG